MMDLSMVPYPKSQSVRAVDDVVETKPFTTATTTNLNRFASTEPPSAAIKYGECMRNHAASIGGHASDGCGEFMPDNAAGNSLSLSLSCAACGCHRNFHRRDPPLSNHSHHHHLLNSPRPPPPLLLYGASVAAAHHSFHHNVLEEMSDRRSETPEREEVAQQQKQPLEPAAAAARERNKRFRTRFTAEQKEKMMEYAESCGWRIQRRDDVALNSFCSEVGVPRKVLKVWMHNNKNAHRRRRESSPSPPPPPQQSPSEEKPVVV